MAGQLCLRASLCYVLTLQVERRTKEDPSSYYSPSPNLMTGWRGGVDATKEYRTGIRIGTLFFCPLLKDP
jgi:hypothetical protein